LLMRYYDGAADIPDEVVVPTALEDGAVLEEWLTEKKGRGVSLVSPKRGETLALVGIAGRNAENALKSTRLAAGRPEEALRLLEEKLNLHSASRRIECFDISNIGGKYAVGSLVAFAAGLPAKEGYRRFRIRTVPGADDYAMMYEVLKRRYQERENLPDLIMVDGGKGQLGVALAVLKDLGIEGLDVIGLAKERDDRSLGGAVAHRRRTRKTDATTEPGPPDAPADADFLRTREMHAADDPEGAGLSGSAEREGVDPVSDAGRVRSTENPGKEEDRVYLPGRKDPVYLSRWPEALFLLQRIRDEAHRFAVTYHRKVKEKADLQSLLDRIPGIGPARRKALLIFFGDVTRVRAASVDDLRQVEGIGEQTALRIRTFLDGNPI
jgi:excinuclease ABC subunit C